MTANENKKVGSNNYDDPNKTFVNVNYKCNNNCVTCIREDSNRFCDEPNIDYVKKQIIEILKYSDHVEFNGGEPTLRKDIFKIIRFAHMMNNTAQISLLTNARMFCNERLCVRVQKFGRKIKIITSIYGHNSKLHDSITRTPNSFDQQIKGINNLIRHGISIELRVIISGLNFKSLVDISKYIATNFEPKQLEQISLVNMKMDGIAADNAELVACRTSEIIEPLRIALNLLKESCFNVNLYHFPHCVLTKEMMNFSIGRSAEISEISYPKKCNTCSYLDRCSGVWKGYISRYGDAEFVPIKINKQDAVLEYLGKLNHESGISGRILIQSVKDLFKELNISKIGIREAVLRYYPIAETDSGHCGTCLCIGGWGVLEGKSLKGFTIDSDLNIEKGGVVIPYKNNRCMFSLYVSILNSIIAQNPNIIQPYLMQTRGKCDTVSGNVITKIGFELHDCINYSEIKELNIIDRGIFEEKQRRDESKIKFKNLRGYVGDKCKVKIFKNATHEIIVRSDVLLITGSAISNGTLDGILKDARNAREIIIWGRSALLYPKILFENGCTRVIGSIASADIMKLAKENPDKYAKISEPGKQVRLLRLESESKIK